MMLPHRWLDDILLLGCTSENYRNSLGRDSFIIGITLDEEGQFLQMEAPGLYYYKGLNPACLLECLNDVNLATKLIKYVLYPANGEIKAEIDLPLQDAELQANQLMRMVLNLWNVIEKYHPLFQSVLEMEPHDPTENPELVESSKTGGFWKSWLEQFKTRDSGLQEIYPTVLTGPDKYI
ncbi:MAG: hypothetical protein HQM12_19325 [SAR324 cluster bacterium]|nr:hypothetical protein [SAR324 cluster bacterium]